MDRFTDRLDLDRPLGEVLPQPSNIRISVFPYPLEKHGILKMKKLRIAAFKRAGKGDRKFFLDVGTVTLPGHLGRFTAAFLPAENIGRRDASFPDMGFENAGP